MTKKQLLERVETAYDMGLMDESTLGLANGWVDAIMRFENI